MPKLIFVDECGCVSLLSGRHLTTTRIRNNFCLLGYIRRLLVTWPQDSCIQFSHFKENWRGVTGGRWYGHQRYHTLFNCRL